MEVPGESPASSGVLEFGESPGRGGLQSRAEDISSASLGDGTPHLLSPQRWLWAASKVHKMPNGLLHKSKLYFGSQVDWNERFLVLPAFTGCLHWFKDDGSSNLDTLGKENGSFRLRDICTVEVEPQATGATHKDEQVLKLSDAKGGCMMAFRARADIIDAWKRAILAGKERAQEWPPTGLWLQNTLDGMGVDEPPEPLAVDSVIQFDDHRIQCMGFANRVVNDSSNLCSGFMSPVARLRLFVVSDKQIRMFDPKDKCLFKHLVNALDLSSIRDIRCTEKKVMLKFPLCNFVMVTPHNAEWTRVLNARVANALPHSRSDNFKGQHAENAGRGASRRKRCRCCPRWPCGCGSAAGVWSVACQLLLWNGSLAMALLLQDTRWWFWLYWVLVNLVFACKAASAEPAFAATFGAVAAFVGGSIRLPSKAGEEESQLQRADTGDQLGIKAGSHSSTCRAPPNRSASTTSNFSSAEVVRHFLPIGPGFGCAEDGGTSAVMVRGADYKATNVKVPSASPFYELVRVEVMPPPAAGGMHCHVGAQGAVLEEDQNVAGAESAQEDCHSMAGSLPHLFIVNVQLPEAAGSLFGQAKCDCSSVVFYNKIRTSTLEASKASQRDPALLLLQKFCAEAPTNRELLERGLKVICDAKGVNGASLPPVLRRLRPALVAKAGTLLQGPGYLELDINITACKGGQWQATSLRSHLGNMELTFSIVVQGNSEAELPERLWTCATLRAVQLDAQQGAQQDAAAAELGTVLPFSPSETSRGPPSIRQRSWRPGRAVE